MRRLGLVTSFAVLITVTGLAVLASACGHRPPDEPKNYVADLAAARAAKDAAFEHDAEPVPDNRKKELLPLAYFAIDPAYAVPAELKLDRAREPVKMPTSTGQVRDMRRVGRLEFTLKEQHFALTAFIEAGATDVNRLFVPFTDLTTGTETYAAGRYLDLDRSVSGVYVVDFNRAYHPFCYFSPTYDCPFPPAENRLKIPIRAGEKLKAPAR